MDCKTARLLIELERPWASELGSADVEALRSHLADCPDCAPLRAEQRCDETMGRAIRAVAVPDGLRERILSRLNRRPWHQRPAVRWSASAAAAVLLFSAGLAWWNHRIAVDLEDRALTVNKTFQNAKEVDDWFAEQGIATRAPRGQGLSFDYNLLTFRDLVKPAKFQGQTVPLLIFRQGAAEARVYILDAARFDMSILNGAPSGSGRFTVIGLPSDDERFGYIIEYSGGSLQTFFHVGGLPPA